MRTASQRIPQRLQRSAARLAGAGPRSAGTVRDGGPRAARAGSKEVRLRPPSRHRSARSCEALARKPEPSSDSTLAEANSTKPSRSAPEWDLCRLEGGKRSTRQIGTSTAEAAQKANASGGRAPPGTEHRPLRWTRVHRRKIPDIAGDDVAATVPSGLRQHQARAPSPADPGGNQPAIPEQSPPSVEPERNPSAAATRPVLGDREAAIHRILTAADIR